jgi:hypothetical protein
MAIAADDRAKAVELALSQIEKQFGKGSIVRLGSKKRSLPIAVISTGSISFDAALGVGGIPRGRVTEIYGPESSGKTTICLQIIAEAQRAGGLAAFVDAEHALDPATPRNWASMSTTCSSRSPTPASRPSRLLRPWSVRRHRCAGCGLRGGSRAQGRTGRRDGRLPHGPAGPPHVPGPAQAHRHRLQIAHRADFH